MMKKFTAILLSLIIVLCLSACGENSSEPDSSVDVDLTKSGGTVLFAQLTLMQDNISEYVGKTIRMEGSFSPFQVFSKDGSSTTRCSCIVWDNTKCCTAGLDFTIEGASYPDGYPEIGKTIIVEGLLEADTLYGLPRGMLTGAKILKVK